MILFEIHLTEGEQGISLLVLFLNIAEYVTVHGLVWDGLAMVWVCLGHVLLHAFDWYLSM